MAAVGARLEHEARQEALARVRVSAPLAIGVLVVGLVISSAVGIPLHAWVVGFNAVAILLLVGVLILISSSRDASLSIHVIAAVTWLLMPMSSLASMAATHADSLALPIMALVLAAPWVQVSRLGLALSTGLTMAVFFALAPTVDGELSVNMARAGVIGAGVVANVAGTIAWRRFIESLTLRSELRTTNEALTRELEERRRSESEAETYRDQFIAAQRSEAIGSLAAGLAHEMNNVLAGILTASELLATESSDAGAVEATASAIAREAQRGGALTQSLLAFARRGQYRRGPSQLDEILDEVRRLLLRTLDRSVVLQHDWSSSAVVDVDRAQLIQAILNLALNAADAMPEGGTLTMSTGRETLAGVRAEALGLDEGQYAVVSVSDTGHGMDPDTRRRAFEPFFTTKAPGKGTGLGLAMVDGSVRAQGGSLELQSALGEGTRVQLILPICAAAAAPLERAAPILPATRSGTVLVIDDEPLVRSALGRLLSHTGLDVVTATNGAEGLSMFEEHAAIDLVLCDMNMPVMGGSDCIRAIAKVRRVPVLIVSGYVAATEARELIADGLAHGIVEKPFTSADVIAAVDSALAQAVSADARGSDHQEIGA